MDSTASKFHTAPWLCNLQPSDFSPIKKDQNERASYTELYDMNLLLYLDRMQHATETTATDIYIVRLSWYIRQDISHGVYTTYSSFKDFVAGCDRLTSNHAYTTQYYSQYYRAGS